MEGPGGGSSSRPSHGEGRCAAYAGAMRRLSLLLPAALLLAACGSRDVKPPDAYDLSGTIGGDWGGGGGSGDGWANSVSSRGSGVGVDSGMGGLY